jgi:RimJ/RimL family protein N-acetyltransferase
MPQSVHIRPVRESDLEVMARLTADPAEASEFGFFGHRDVGRIRRDFAENGFLGSDSGTLAVAVGPDGEYIGDVSWHPQRRGPTSYCWNIGIALLASARGHGYGTAAQRLLAEYLFAHTQANRVEAETEVGNVAERKSLEKAGFTFEGVVRGSCYRAGKWRDMASYSILRADVHED